MTNQSVTLATLLQDTSTFHDPVYINTRVLELKRFRHGVPMAARVHVTVPASSNKTYIDALEEGIKEAKEEFPLDDKYEVSFHMTPEQLEQFVDFLKSE